MTFSRILGRNKRGTGIPTMPGACMSRCASGGSPHSRWRARTIGDVAIRLHQVPEVGDDILQVIQQRMVRTALRMRRDVAHFSTPAAASASMRMLILLHAPRPGLSGSRPEAP